MSLKWVKGWNHMTTVRTAFLRIPFGQRGERKYWGIESGLLGGLTLAKGTNCYRPIIFTPFPHTPYPPPTPSSYFGHIWAWLQNSFKALYFLFCFLFTFLCRHGIIYCEWTATSVSFPCAHTWYAPPPSPIASEVHKLWAGQQVCVCARMCMCV